MGMTGPWLRGEILSLTVALPKETGLEALTRTQEPFPCPSPSTPPALLVLVQQHIRAVLRNKVKGGPPDLSARRAPLSSQAW